MRKADAGPAPGRGRPPESEKITVNLGFIDLGQIDLLVAEGFYSNRTDFIRTAIRNQLAIQADTVRQVSARRMLVVGLQRFGAAELEALRAAGEQVHIRVLGLAQSASDVAPELARETIASISVLGALHASPEIRKALAGRIV